MQKMDEKFVYFATLPSLQEMACFRVALSIWHGYISRSEYGPEKSDSNDELIATFGLGIDYVIESDELVESLNVPRSFKKDLQRYLDKVRREMDFWISSFKYDFFSGYLVKFRLDERLFEDPNRCVWMPNGNVDFVESALKMLSIEELSNEQRFAIMSIFCMEDKIKTVPIDSFSESFIERVNFDFDSELYYWICYLKHELHRVPLLGYSSIDETMSLRSKYIQGTFYFFNRLGANGRLTLAREHTSYRSFPDLYMAVFIQKLISGLPFDQQRQLLLEKSHRIIMSLGCFEESRQSAIWIWEHYKDVMTVQQFAEMMMQIFEMETQVEKKIMFTEIWDTALDHNRNYAVQNTPNASILKLVLTSSKNIQFSGFIYKFLSLKDADSRYKLVIDNALTFKHYICAEARSIENEIIKLCVPSSDDREDLFNLVMNTFLKNNQAKSEN